MTSSAWSTSKPPSKTASAWNVARSLGRQQVVAPVDRALERPLARRGVARSRTGQRQVRREPVADGGRRQERQPGRGQLDAERQAVEQRADLGDDRQVRAGLPVRPDRAGAIDEQARRRVEVGSISGAVSGQPLPTASGRTGYSCSPPTWSGARLVTTNLEPGRGADERRDVARRLEQVLEVVEQRAGATDRPRNAGNASAAGRSTPSNRPRVRAIVDVTSAGSVRPSSATNQAPSRQRGLAAPRELDRRGWSCRSRRVRSA